jgi:hypothetical protein
MPSFMERARLIRRVMSREMNDSFERPLLKVLCCIALSFAIGAAASDASDRPGASTLARVPVVDLPQAPIYWHLDSYRTRAEADAAKGPRSAVVETFAKVWLFTLAEADWRPTGGTRVAMIGPLGVRPEGRYTASYMQAATSPGFQTAFTSTADRKLCSPYPERCAWRPPTASCSDALEASRC